MLGGLLLSGVISFSFTVSSDVMSTLLVFESVLLNLNTLALELMVEVKEARGFTVNDDDAVCTVCWPLLVLFLSTLFLLVREFRLKKLPFLSLTGGGGLALLAELVVVVEAAEEEATGGFIGG